MTEVGSIYKYRDKNNEEQYWCCTDIQREGSNFTFGGITTERVFPLIDDIDKISTSFPLPFWYDARLNMQRLLTDLTDATPDGSISEEELVDQYIHVRIARVLIHSVLKEISSLKHFNKCKSGDLYTYGEGIRFNDTFKPGRVYTVYFKEDDKDEKSRPYTFVMIMSGSMGDCSIANITKLDTLVNGKNTYVSGATLHTYTYGKYRDEFDPQLEIGIIHPKIYSDLFSKSLVMHSTFYENFDQYIIKDIRKLFLNQEYLEQFTDTYFDQDSSEW